MPVENERRVNEVIAKGTLAYGVKSTDHKIAKPIEVDADGNISVALNAGLNSEYVDDSAFATTTDYIQAMGALYDEAAPSGMAEDHVGIPRMSVNRDLYIQIRDGLNTERSAYVNSNNNLMSCRGEGGVSSSGIKSADAQIKASAGAVYWLTVSDDTDALAIELNDSGDDSGTDLWGFDLPAGGYAHFIFDPPLEFSSGIWLDVDDADNTCKVTVGYI